MEIEHSYKHCVLITIMEDQDISVTDKIIENIDEDKVEASVEPAASVVESEPKVVNQRARPPKTAGLYNQAIISQAVQLEIREVGRNLVGVLLTKLRTTIEGTCIAEGFVKPSSIVLLTYSSGIASGARILFNVVFQCEVPFGLVVSGLNRKKEKVRVLYCQGVSLSLK